MTELNARIIAKASATSGEAPLAGDLEVAEIAVNTADGKFFTKHTDGTVKEISGSGGGGGGGAVDSVNGETGVVSLGIQDMDDFELNLFPGAKGILFEYSNENGNGAYQWNGASVAGFVNFNGEQWFLYNALGGHDGTIPDFVVGDEYRIYHQGESVIATCSAPSGLYSGGGSQYVPLGAGSWPAGWINTDPNVSNGAIYLDYDLLSPKPIAGVSIDLADGDILQWDDTTQKFNPAQLPAGGGGGKDRIQDMDDYGAPTLADDVVSNTNFVSSGVSAPGDWTIANADAGASGLSFLQWHDSPAQTPMNQFAVGDVLSLSSPGLADFTSTVSEDPTPTGDTFYLRFADELPAEWLSVTSGASLTVSTETVPLVEGDVLRWVDAVQKFRPTQSKDRIQDMDDFALIPGPGPTYDLAAKDATNPGTGEAERNGTAIFLSAIDKNGIDWLSSYQDTNLFAVGTDVTVYVNDVQVADTTFSYAEYLSGRAATITTDTAWTDNLVIGDEIRFDIPGFAASMPLAEGDILQWVEADQKFNPVTLTDNDTKRIQDMDDFELVPAGSVRSWTNSFFEDTFPPAGLISNYASIEWALSVIDNDGTDHTAVLYALDSDQAVTVLVDGAEVYNGTAGTWGNKSEGKITLRFGDDSWKSILAGGEVISLNLPVFDPVDEPLHEGDILRWNDVDQKFKPAQSSDISVTIDSLDEIGDVEYYTSALSSTWSTPNDSNPAADEYRVYASGLSRLSTTSLVGLEKDDLLSRLIVGANVELVVNGVTHTGTVSSAAGLEDAGTSTERVTATFSVSPPFTDTTLSDTSLVLSYLDEEATTAPPSEGDILQWNGVDQKFKPAQLPAGGGAVDSVNGETGVVELGIQDMDDFTLTPISDSLQWATRTEGDIVAGGYQFNGDGSYIYVSNSTLDGNVEAQLDQLTDVQVVFTIGSASLVANTGDVDERIGIVRAFELNSIVSGSAADLIAQDASLPLTIAYGPWSAGFEPLAEGDILQWDDTVQKFKPAQLSAGGGGAVDSVNGETGVVSLGIQEMDDFELVTNRPEGTVLRFTPGGWNANVVDGQWTALGQSVIFNSPDADGIDSYIDMLDYDYTQGVWVSTDNIDWAPVADIAKTFDNSVVIQLTATNWGPIQEQLNNSETSTDLYILLGSASGETTTPLSEGDTLQWNDADQKFKPAPSVDRIQDANDFEFLLGRPAGTAFRFTPAGWDASVTDGQWTADSQSLLVRTPDADGVDVYSSMGSYNYTQGIWVSTNNSDWTPVTGVQKTFDNGVLIQLRATDWGSIQEQLDNSETSTDLYILLENASDKDPIPLSEGDILQWIDVDQKFKPSSDYISLTALKAEVAAATDFADFQSRIAAL